VTFASPLGLLALLAIPAIVAIHLFRRRFPVRPVAGLFLWQMMRQTPEGGRRIARLPITTSLVLECIAALALALILAGARLSPAAVSRHLVVLLDDSASMAAASARGESARDRAVARVLSEVERLGRGARITIITSGDRPSVVSGPAALAVEARTALDAWRPGAPDHSLGLGLRLARELAGSTGMLMIASDLPPAVRAGTEVEGALWVSVGEPLANAGITAADRSISPSEGRGTISLTLANDDDAPARRRLDVSAAGSTILTRDLDVPPGISSFTLPIPPGLPVVRVALSDDALARDNEVTLAEPRPRIVGVDNRLADGRGRDALARALGALSGVTRADAPHLAFVDAGALDQPAPPGLWRVGFGRPPSPWTAQGAPGDYAGPFVLEKRHPLLLGMTLGGVVWTGAVPLRPGAMHPVASAGDRILVGTLPESAARTEPTVLVNLDLDRTNLIRSPDWPILISNVVEMRRQALPGPERWNYRIGEWVRIGLGREPKAPLRFRCGSVERILPPGRQVEFVAPAPGGLLQVFEGDEVLFDLGVNFLDASETELRNRATAEAGALADVPGRRGESGPSSDPLFWLLLAACGAAIVANWWVLSPRRRPA
jgi:hypothetical protein